MADYNQTVNKLKPEKMLMNFADSKDELFKPNKYNIFDKNMVTMPTGRTDLSSQPMFQRDSGSAFTFSNSRNK